MGRSFAYYGNERFIDAVNQRLVDAGFSRAQDAAYCDIILTFFTSQSALEELYFGDEGLIQKATPDSILVDVSAMTPGFAREVNALATVSDLVMVEAPLIVVDMVAPDAFAQENLICYAASEENGIEQARDLLECLFGEVRETNAPGLAQLERATHTLQACAETVSLIEALSLCRAQARLITGAKRDDAFDLQVNSAQAASLLQAIKQERFDGDFTVEMFMAELSAALAAADDAELIMPEAEAAMHLIELLMVIGGADKSPAALSLVYDEEEMCAKHGLDWERAEQVYGHKDDDDLYEDDDYDDDYDDYDDNDDYADSYGGFGYSSN